MVNHDQLIVYSSLKQKDCKMLVLTRKHDESIMIGDNVKITIIAIRGDKVRLGIEAPKDVSVHRQEVYEAIQREHRKGQSNA